ncbi:hypothetical protein H9P43_003675 [Blastocladiella emersonii ATCC 22665]|nr:hypothetical protein H9P43_003675 [Blastocladiella emersonii ATCC 22665]
MAIDFLAPAKVFEIKQQLAGANIDKAKVLDSLQCKDKSPSATRTTRSPSPTRCDGQ